MKSYFVKYLTFAAVQSIEKIYRYIATILILGVMLVQTFSNGVMVVSYYFNTGAYAKNCENQDKPWMHCNGKCQLLKKMNEDGKKDTQNQEQKTVSIEVLSSKSFFSTAPIVVMAGSAIPFPINNDNRLQQMPRSIFRPPSC